MATTADDTPGVKMKVTMRKTAIFSAFILVSSWMNIIHAQGTSGFEILRLQTQPRGSSLAGALIADAGHIENIFYNPAGLAALQKRAVTAGYMNYLLDIQSGHAAYVDPTQPWGTWSVFLNYTNYGDFDGRTPTGVPLPTFTASDIVLGAAYARKIRDNINVGGGIKFVQSDIEDYTARALALDMSGQMTLIEEKLRFGAGIFNLGGTIQAYDDYKDTLPLYYRFGIWGVPEGLPANLYLSFTMYHEYADNYSLNGIIGSGFVDFLSDFYVGAGAEFNPMEVVHLRIGYDTIGLDQKVGTRKDALAGICLGLGIDVTVFRMDYGLASHGELGFVQRISLSKEL